MEDYHERSNVVCGALMFGVVIIAANVNAQGVPQAVEITKVDVQKVSAGYRARWSGQLYTDARSASCIDFTSPFGSFTMMYPMTSHLATVLRTGHSAAPIPD